MKINKQRTRKGSVLLIGRQRERFLRFLSLTLHVRLDSLLERYERIYSLRSKDKGELNTLKFLKSVYTCSCRYAAGQEVYPIPFTKSDKDNFPKLFVEFKKYLSGSVNEKRAALAILNLWRIPKVKGPWSCNTITDPGILVPKSSSEGVKVGGYFSRLHTEKNIEDISTQWKNLLESTFPSDKIGVRLKSLKNLNSLHISSKNGPNGPAVSTAVIDWFTLSSEMKSAIKQMVTLTGNLELKKLITRLEGEPLSFDGAIHSKISLKVEPGGKMRPFAICDWWSHSSLKALHSYQFSWLSNQEEDGTFSHYNISQKCREWTKRPISPSEVVISSDLSAATDRLPRELQAEIIAQMFGEELANTWLMIAGERQFKTPDGDMVTYAVGQPMGLLSSWSSMAMLHHLIVRLAGLLSHQPTKGNYVIIGDDISTKGLKLAKSYQDLMSNKLGVSISKEKSFDPTSPPHFREKEPLHSCEIAKRIFVNGEEITPLSPEEILEGFGKPSGFPSLLLALRNRGWVDGTWEEPVPALAALSDKPRTALILSTFPCSPAPNYVGVTGLYKGVSTSVGDRSFGCTFVPPWWSYPYSEVELAFSGELRKRIVDSLKSTREMHKKFKTFLSDPEVEVKVARWRVRRDLLGLILERVSNQGINLLNKSLGGLVLKANVPSSELKREIGKHTTLIDLKLILLGRTNFIDEKRKTANFLQEIQKKVLRKLE